MGGGFAVNMAHYYKGPYPFPTDLKRKFRPLTPALIVALLADGQIDIHEFAALLAAGKE